MTTGTAAMLRRGYARCGSLPSAASEQMRVRGDSGIMEELMRWHLGDEARACTINGDGGEPGVAAVALRMLP